MWSLAKTEVKHNPTLFSPRVRNVNIAPRREFFLLWPWQPTSLTKGQASPNIRPWHKHLTFQGNNIKANSLSLPNTRLIVRNFQLPWWMRFPSLPKFLGSIFPLLKPNANKTTFLLISKWLWKVSSHFFFVLIPCALSLGLPCFAVMMEIQL